MRYVTALETEDISQQKTLFNELREYCERDTLAMLKVRQALARIYQANESE